MLMSSRLVLKILIIILVVIPGITGITTYASDRTPTDSLPLVVRVPDKEFVESYLQKKEFSYSNPPASNFLSQLIDRLWAKIKSWGIHPEKISFLVKIAMGVLVLFALFMLVTQTKIYRIFYTDKALESPDYQFSSADTGAVDYENEIRIQVEQGQYRVAIRLCYLKVIGMLRGKELIRYSNDRTNRDYLDDLTHVELKSAFYSLTMIFNHVWYGDTEITENQYRRFEKHFESFYKAIDETE
jgi:hypothetical protein